MARSSNAATLIIALAALAYLWPRKAEAETKAEEEGPYGPPPPPSPRPVPVPAPAEQWFQFEALHAYDVTMDAVDGSDLEAVKAAVFPVLGAVLAAPMTAYVTGPGAMYGDRITVRLRLGVAILAGGMRVALNTEIARENVQSIWILAVTDRGLFGLGGGS